MESFSNQSEYTRQRKPRHYKMFFKIHKYSVDIYEFERRGSSFHERNARNFTVWATRYSVSS